MSRSTSVLGLDIGSAQIKAVHLERRRGSWSLQGAGMVPTPPDSVNGGLITDTLQVADAVKQLLREYRLPAVDTIAAVSGSPVTVRAVKIPDMPVAALKKSIRFEAAKYLPAIDDSVVEFELLGKSGAPPQMDVLLVAAPREMVSGRVVVLEHAGLEPVAVDVEAFALVRLLEAANLIPGPGQGLAVVNIGATFTDLNILVGKEIAVTRSIPLGGNALTSTLASVLNASPEEAEARKRQVSLAVRNDGPFDYNTEDDGTAAMTRAITPFLDEIIRELRRSVNFFQSQAAEAGHTISVDQLLLTGGTARLEGAVDYMSDRLGMGVALLDPFSGQGPLAGKGGGNPMLEHGSELGVAIGLALKEYE